MWRGKFGPSDDPNFGYEVKGGTLTLMAGNYIHGSKYPCPETGTAQSITAYLRQYSVYKPKISFAIYRVSDGALTGYTEEWTLTAGWDDWKTLNIVSGGALEATDYWLVVWKNEHVYGAYDAGAAGQFGYAAETYNYPSWPDPWSPVGYEAWKLSIYCTYTVPVVAGVKAMYGGLYFVYPA